MLSNRLHYGVVSVISKSQTTFAHGKKIRDEILTANELVNGAHRLKKEILLFKLNKSVYDFVTRIISSQIFCNFF